MRTAPGQRSDIFRLATSMGIGIPRPPPELWDQFKTTFHPARIFGFIPTRLTEINIWEYISTRIFPSWICISTEGMERGIAA